MTAAALDRVVTLAAQPLFQEDCRAQRGRNSRSGGTEEPQHLTHFPRHSFLACSNGR